MIQLKPPAEADWQAPVEGLRVLMRPLSTSVVIEAQRIRASLFENDPEARLPEGQPAPGADDEDAPVDEAVLARRMFLMGVAYVAAGAEAWEGLADVDGTALTQPRPEKILHLLEQEPRVFNHFDKGYIDQAFLLSMEKNASTPSPDTSTAREAEATARTPAKGSSAAATQTPAP